MNQGLLAFKAIVENRTVHAAADQLGLTQTAVTQRLKGLEKDLGLTLFLRSRRGMSLTSDGTALLQYCRATEDLEGAFLSRISGKRRDDIEVTIVGPTSAISTRVLDDCRKLYIQYPHLRLHLRADDHSNRIDLVRRGEADLAIVHPDGIPNEMESKCLKPDTYLLLASPKWSRRRLDEILENERMIDFYERDQTTINYLKQFGLISYVKKQRLFMNQNEGLISLFSQGIGYGTLTETVARPYLQSGQLCVLNNGKGMKDPLALIWYPRTQKPDYFRDLIRCIK